VIGETLNGVHVGGVHIIRGISEEDVIRIQAKFKISASMGAEGSFRIICKSMNPDWGMNSHPIHHDDFMRKLDMQTLIKRRKGIGGFVWFEDEKGNLQKET